MSVRLHVQKGIEFRKDLYNANDRKPWLEAVGDELEKRQFTLRLGDGYQAFGISNKDDLLKFYTEYKKDPKGMAKKIGLPEGKELNEFVRDLVQAIDDVVKPTSAHALGDTVDLRTKGELAKFLGLDDDKARYASLKTPMGNATPVDGAFSVLGVRLSKDPFARTAADNLMHMSEATFAGLEEDVRGLTGRDNQEFEAVRRLNGMDTQELIKWVRGTDNRGRPILNRMRKAKAAEAFSIGYRDMPMDEMNWGRRAHALRESMPYLSLTVENGRFEKDENNGEWEVSQGTDYFADTYYTAVDPNNPSKNLLETADLSIRGRVRYDEPGTPRRVLIQTKKKSISSETGMKSAAKMDIRKDMPDANVVDNLDSSVKLGRANWSYRGEAQPVTPLAVAYSDLKEKGVLPTVGGVDNALILEAGANIMSVRSRYHLNETDPAATKKFLDNGETILRTVREWVHDSKTLSPSQKKELLTSIADTLDRDDILARAKEGLLKLDPNLKSEDIDKAYLKQFWPRGRTAEQSVLDNQKRRVVADAIKASYDAAAEKINDLRDAIAGQEQEPFAQADVADAFIDFVKEKHPELQSKTTNKAFMDLLAEKKRTDEGKAFLKEFAETMVADGNDLFTKYGPRADCWEGLERYLIEDQLQIAARQLETVGSTAKSLWFNEARKTYANAHVSGFSNFLIDTFDFVQDIRPEDWKKLSAEEKNGLKQPPADVIYNADIIAEVQIELGKEKPYMEAKAKIKTDLALQNLGLLKAYFKENPPTGMDEAGWSEHLKGLQSASATEQAALLKRFNMYLSSKGFDAIDLKTLPRLEAEKLNADLAIPTLKDRQALFARDKMLDFMWNELQSAQDIVANLRGDRIMSVAERNDVEGLSWEHATMSKGEKALALVSE